MSLQNWKFIIKKYPYKIGSLLLKTVLLDNFNYYLQLFGFNYEPNIKHRGKIESVMYRYFDFNGFDIDKLNYKTDIIYNKLKYNIDKEDLFNVANNINNMVLTHRF